jgi:uncharacterized protein
MNPDTQFFWDAAAEHDLRIQRCLGCGQLRHPPGPACPSCHSLEWDAVSVSGRGVLYSYTVLYHPPTPGFYGPAIVCVVQLDEGVRLVSNVIDSEPSLLRIGQPLEVCFLDQEEGWTVPQFRVVGF